MAIDWGAYDGHLRVGIDHVISPANPSHSDTTVDVTWKFYVDSDGWSFNDTETLHYSGDGFGTIDNSFTNNSSGASILVGTHKETYSISYNSGSKSASANLTGAYNGATPSKTTSVNLPDRPVATPSAGESPTAGAITSTGATISWGFVTDNGGATVDKYELQVSTGSGFTNNVYDNSNINGVSQIVTGLSPNTKYYARVRAHNSAGWGDWTLSTYCPFTTLGGTPGVPGTPLMTSRTQSQIAVSWSAAAANGGTGMTYEIQCSLSSSFATLVSDVNVTGTNKTSVGLTANTTYYFRVRATNSLGTSGWSGTLAQATLANAATTFTDSGDFVTLVNNLANAVGDKMVHLGIHTFRGKTGSTSLTSGTFTTLNISTTLENRGPDGPSWVGSGTNDVLINYPGLYYVECAFLFDEGLFAAGSGQRGIVRILVNGAMMSSTNPHGGYSEAHRGLGVSTTSEYAVARTVIPLAQGDYLGWQVHQNSGQTMTQPTPGTSLDLYAWCKVAMVGF